MPPRARPKPAVALLDILSAAELAELLDDATLRELRLMHEESYRELSVKAELARQQALRLGHAELLRNGGRVDGSAAVPTVAFAPTGSLDQESGGLPHTIAVN